MKNMTNKLALARQSFLILGLSASGIFTNVASANELSTSYELGLEARVFTESPRFDDQVDTAQLSLSFEPELRWRSEDRTQRVSFVGFSRLDSADGERSRVDIRELLYEHNWDRFTLTAGINKVFWGVTESVHLVDVINQSDLIEDIDQEDKLGQPMILASWQQDWGKVDAFVLPYFRTRTFASEKGRFFFGLPISDDAAYESDREEHHVDFALRYSHYLGDMDIGLHFFDGTNREPQIRPNLSGTLTPFYEQMQQTGIDLQYTVDAWLFKFEGLYRTSDFDDFGAAVGGFEYTIFQLNDSAMDLGLLAEYQFDDRNQDLTFTLADNDLFLGARLGFNDTQDTAVLAGVVNDLDTHSRFFNLEAERRFGNQIVGELRARVFDNIDRQDPLRAFSQDDYVEVSLSYFF